MAFVADGAEWNFDGWPAAEIISALDQLLNRVAVAKDRKETVWVGDDLQTRNVLGTLSLWELWSPQAPVHPSVELRQELAAWLGQAPRYLDEEVWPAGMAEATAVQISTELATENPDLAWAHHNVRANRAVACLGLRRTGPAQTETTQGDAIVHWVRDEESHRTFWREAVVLEGDDAATLERLAPHAFPDLYFHIDAWHGLPRLAGGYTALRAEVRRYLTALDDIGKWVFTAAPPPLRRDEAAGPDLTIKPSNQIIERRFMGLNLDMAPENPGVFADSTCRRAREIVVGGRSIYCEWHGKLQPHRNRVHIHPPIPESNGKVVVAIFDMHLPLPGN